MIDAYDRPGITLRSASKPLRYPLVPTVLSGRSGLTPKYGYASFGVPPDCGIHFSCYAGKVNPCPLSCQSSASITHSFRMPSLIRSSFRLFSLQEFTVIITKNRSFSRGPREVNQSRALPSLQKVLSMGGVELSGGCMLSLSKRKEKRSYNQHSL